jgi:cytochrome bd ubiquinol oxidase subunit II
MTLFGTPPEQWLPLVFASLMGMAILAYVVLDGYDLGVGILMANQPRADRDVMVGSIGPFWDANETWLVLGVGILLVAFPVAHGIILTALYLPVALMLLGLTLRGVAFEFRVKAHDGLQGWWDRAFVAGSLLATVTQGMMLGSYIMGFEQSWRALAFSLLAGLGLVAAYGFLGAAWLIFKTEGELQAKAVGWARKALVGTGAGMAAISLATPLVSERIFKKWFSVPEIILLAPIPLMTGLIMLSLWIFLKRMPRADHGLDLVPFAGGLTLFLLGFAGLAYSFFPYVVPDRLTIFEAASAPESLIIILAGALVVLPVIVAYSAFAYWVFRGKASALKYE